MNASESINFTVAQETEPKLFFTILVVAALVSASIVGVGLLIVYFKKVGPEH